MPPKYKQINPYPLTIGGPPQQRFQNPFTPYSPTYINQSTSPQHYQIISPLQQQPIYSVQSPRQQQSIYPIPQQINPQIQNQVVGSQQTQKDPRDRLISNKTANINNNIDSQRRTMTFNISTQKKQQNDTQIEEIANLKGQITPSDFDGNQKDISKLLLQKLQGNNIEKQSPNCDTDTMQNQNLGNQKNKEVVKQEQLISNLNKQIEELQQQNENLQNQINDTANANNQEYLQILRDQIKGERGQNELLSDQIKQLQQQMTKERVEMKILEQKIQLINQNKLTQSKLQQNDDIKLKEQMEQLQIQNKELKLQKDQDELEKSRKNQYIEILREQLEGERAHNEFQLSSGNKVSEEDLENLKLKSQQEQDQLKKIIAILENDKLNYSSQIKNLTKQLQEEINNRDNNKKQQQQQQQQQQLLLLDQEKPIDENQNLKQYINILREQLDAERAHNNFHSNEINVQIDQLKQDQLNGQGGHNEQNYQQDEQLKYLENQVNQLKEEKENQVQYIKILREQLETERCHHELNSKQKNNIDNEHDEYQEEIKSLQQQINIKEQEIQNLQEYVKILREQLNGERAHNEFNQQFQGQ